MTEDANGASTCVKCRGVYLDPQPDGSRYFHVCPGPPPVMPAQPPGVLGRIRRRLAPRAPTPPGKSHRLYWEGL